MHRIASSVDTIWCTQLIEIDSIKRSWSLLPQKLCSLRRAQHNGKERYFRPSKQFMHPTKTVKMPKFGYHRSRTASWTREVSRLDWRNGSATPQRAQHNREMHVVGHSRRKSCVTYDEHSTAQRKSKIILPNRAGDSYVLPFATRCASLAAIGAELLQNCFLNERQK